MEYKFKNDKWYLDQYELNGFHIILYEGKRKNRGTTKEGRFHGNGILHPNEIKLYEGHFYNGKFEGSGICYDKNGKIIYKGNFEDNIYDGIGDLYLNGYVIYKGKFHKGKKQGFGIEYYRNGKEKYIGCWHDNEYEGYGTAFYRNGNIWYQGNFVESFWNGIGTFYNEDGRKIYNGEFVDCTFQGLGFAYNEEEDIIYEGQFENNLWNGKGILYTYDLNGEIYKYYEGSIKEMEIHGYGTSFYENGNIHYKGEFEKGKFEGNGELYYPYNNIIKYKGHFKNGKYHGYGKLYNIRKLEYEGIFKNNIPLVHLEKDIKKIVDFSKEYNIENIDFLIEEDKILEISNLFFEKKENIPNGNYIEIQNILMKLY